MDPFLQLMIAFAVVWNIRPRMTRVWDMRFNTIGSQE